jgi:hypothetical protein
MLTCTPVGLGLYGRTPGKGNNSSMQKIVQTMAALDVRLVLNWKKKIYLFLQLERS